MHHEEKKLLSIRVPPEAAEALAKQALENGVECGPWCAQILTNFAKVPSHNVFLVLNSAKINEHYRKKQNL